MRKCFQTIAACAEEEVKCSTVVPLLFLRKRDCETGSEVGGLEHTHTQEMQCELLGMNHGMDPCTGSTCMYSM